VPVDLNAIAGLGLMLCSRLTLLPVPVDDGLRRVDGRLSAEGLPVGIRLRRVGLRSRRHTCPRDADDERLELPRGIGLESAERR
jgi:hypothetical protein